MPGQATVTGKIGAGVALTAQVIANVSTFSLDSVGKILTLVLANGQIIQVDISAATVCTCAIAGGAFTWVIS